MQWHWRRSALPRRHLTPTPTPPLLQPHPPSQAAVENAAAAVMAWGNAYATDLHGRGMMRLHSLNISSLSFPNTVMDALAKESRVVVDEYASQHAIFSSGYDQYKAYRAAQVVPTKHFPVIQDVVGWIQ